MYLLWNAFSILALRQILLRIGSFLSAQHYKVRQNKAVLFNSGRLRYPSKSVKATYISTMDTYQNIALWERNVVKGDK